MTRGTSVRQRVRIAVVTTAIALLAVLVPAGTAQAHNELVKASPANGSKLERLPKEGRLEFTEALRPRDLTVHAGDRTLPLGVVPGDTRAITFSLAGVTSAETVVLTWTLVDAHDGHRSGGTLRLHVEESAATEAADDPAPARSEPRLLGWLDFSSHLVGFLAMALFVGGLLFLSLLWPAGSQDRRARALLVATSTAGVIAAIGATGVVLWRSSDLSVADALATDYGRAASALVLLWLLAAVVVSSVLQLDSAAVRGVAWRVGAVIVAGGIIRVTGINAHATQGDERVLGITADFLHLCAISAWVGGLVMLSVCLLPRKQLDELEQVVPRFSRVALASVLLIVTSGLLLLWEISRGIDDFWATDYAQVLILKLTLFSLVMLAAMKSKRWVQTVLEEAVAAHRRTAVRSFAVSVTAETVLVISVLGAASVLVTSSPGS